MKIRDLSGYSGCEISLMQDRGVVFVRKTSGSPTYNDRLSKQCEKQRNYSSKFLKAPIVLDSGLTPSGKFFFDMQYIKGVTLAKYIETIDSASIQNLVDIISDSINAQKNIILNPKINTQEIFENKILSLSEETKSSNNQLLKTALQTLSQKDWSHFENTFCHGDMTLENIIVSNGQLYLIDFLDSFYDSWLLDVGKLLQDLQCMWSYRRKGGPNQNAKIRLLIFRKLLLQSLCFDKTIFVDSYYALLLSLTRIYPYAKDKETMDFLDSNVTAVLNLLSKGGENE